MYVGCGSDINASDGFDGIEQELQGSLREMITTPG